MSEVLKKIRDFMEKEGIPGRDAHDLPTSSKAFPDGANYRIEIAGVERASTMEAMIAEATRRGIVVHRAIAAVGGQINLNRPSGQNVYNPTRATSSS